MDIDDTGAVSGHLKSYSSDGCWQKSKCSYLGGVGSAEMEALLI